MKERILEFLKKENKTSAQMAEEIDVQPSGISHILSGRNNPSLDFVLKMLEKYPYLSTEWLLFGKGKMYRENAIPELFEDSDQKVEKHETSRKSIESPLFMPEKEREKETLSLIGDSGVEKIVWFFADKTFREYYPSKNERSRE